MINNNNNLNESLLNSTNSKKNDDNESIDNDFFEELKKKITMVDELPNRGFFHLYKTFATPIDILMVFIGFIAALVNGAIQPMLTVVVGHIFSGRAGVNSDILKQNVDDNIMDVLYLGILAFFTNFFQFVFFMITAERIVKRIKTACFKAIMKQENAYFDVNKSGVLSSRIAEQSNLILFGIGDSFGMGIQFFSQFASAFIIAFYRNWRVAGVMMGLFPAITLILSGLIFSIVHFIKRTTAAYEDAGGIAEEILSSMQTVASFGAEFVAIKKYDKNLNTAEKLGIRLGLVRGIGLGCLFLMIFTCFGVGYFYGSTLIATGNYDVSSIFTAIMSCVIGSISLGLASPNLAAVAQAKAASNVLFKIIERPTQIDIENDGLKKSPNGNNKLNGKIEFKNVSFTYPTRPERLTLNDINLTINSSETCALVGTSGCGKSTCIALIERFYDVDKGEILIDGVNIKNYNLKWLREQIALVGQEPLLFDASIADNIRYGKADATLDEIMEACKTANAHDYIMEFPDGYMTKVGQGGSKLSGGQKQRLAIARALIKKPSILLLDEATSALDNESERQVQNAIDKMLETQNITTIIIAHRLSTIQDANKIIVFDNLDNDGGKIIEVGDHNSLINKSNSAYKQLVKAQEVNESSNPSTTTTTTTTTTTNNNNNNNNNRKYSSSNEYDKSHPYEALFRRESSNAFEQFVGAPMNSSPYNQSPDELLNKKLSNNGSKIIPTTTTLINDYDIENTTELNYKLKQNSKYDDVGIDSNNFDKDGNYIVSSKRVWSYSWEERYYFISGIIGSGLKGSAQPMISIVMSNILTSLILIPSKVEGINFFKKCINNNDCNEKYPYCLDFHDFFPDQKLLGSYCTHICNKAMDCLSNDAVCMNLEAMNVDKKLCIPNHGWLDGHSPSDIKHTGVKALLLYLAIGCCAGVGILLQSYSFGLIGEKLTTRLRSLVFSSMVRQDSTFFDNENNSIGTLLTRLATDTALVKSVTGEYTGIMCENFFSLLLALIISFSASWRMTSVTIIIMPTLIFATWFQYRNIIGRNKTSIESQQDSGKIINEAIGGIRTVQSFGSETKILNLYYTALDKPKRSGIINAYVCGIGSGVARFLFFGVYAFGLYYGGYLVSKDLIEVRNLSKCFFALTLSATTIGQSTARANDLTKAKVATSNIFLLSDRKPKIDPYSKQGIKIIENNNNNEKKFKGDIEFINVNFRYPTRIEVPVLNDISFKIDSGTTAAFVGTSGSGKSSIIRLIERFYDIDIIHNKNSGIFIDNLDIRTLNLQWYRSKIGLVGQEPKLFTGSIIENVRMGKPDATIEEVIEACKKANAHEFIQKFPQQYETECARGSQLSGGQKQRIALARALIKNPIILLLDEATSALDTESEKVVQEALDKLISLKNRTTITIAHRLSTIQNSDKIFVVHNKGFGGEIVEQGNHNELMNIGSNGYYYKLQQMTVRM